MRFLPLLVLFAALGWAATASAAPSDPFQYQRTFDLPTPETSAYDIVINHATGNLLVFDGSKIEQLDPEGNPVDFAALGTYQVPADAPVYGINNTGGPDQGDFYVPYQGATYAYHADGSPLGVGEGGPGIFYPTHEGSKTRPFAPAGGGVDPEGFLWYAYNASDGTNRIEVSKISPDGTPTGVEYVTQAPGLNNLSASCQVLFDGKGHAYVTELVGGVQRYDSAGNWAYEGETGAVVGERSRFAVGPTDALFGTQRIRDVTGNRSTFEEVPYTDPLVKQKPRIEINDVADIYGFALDATGQTLFLSDGFRVDVFHREPAHPPKDLSPLQTKEVRSEGVLVNSTLIPNGAPVTYRYEYGTTTAYGSSTAATAAPVSHFTVALPAVIKGLAPGTTYHIRLVATNSAGTSYGADKVITTYPPAVGGPDPCPNALARKETSARALPDCRAFELVSAANSGGYDIESSIVPNQDPFPGYPLAKDRLLYATHDGAVPGPWNATNKGPDPYLATRGEGGWTTQYEGLPANLNPAAGSFSSVLGEADSALDTFGFAGPGLCSPCFTSGLGTGLPVRLPSGELVQGMAGSLNPGVASAKPEGRIARYLSADGRYLAFASKYAFEPGANQNGDLTVYERDLVAGTTRIVSTGASGTPLTGTVSELGMSADGSRVVVGKGVSTDAEGNEYVIPYLHLAGSAAGVDLAPGAGDGVLFAGMTEDGSKVFFTTVDRLLPADTDSSADLYAAEVVGGGVALSLLSAGNSDACEPVANSARPHWNGVGSGADCGVVAVGGGGGIASASGVAYFLSPAQLGGAGTLNQPNLYRAGPGGSPTFVATLEPDNPLVLDSVEAASARHTADFQTTPQGDYAAFASALPIGGAPTKGLASVFEYAAATGQSSCASCDESGTDEPRVAAPAELAADGLSLLADGEVFFTTPAQLVLKDTNFRADVYAWSGAGPQLISAGNGPFDSGLLTASADGRDVFFFTHDALAPEEDHNGTLIRIYDAREDGGFFRLPAGVPCAASDECHGAGSVAPGPPDIKSAGPTTRGNVLVCKAGKVKKNGRCVRKPKKKKHKAHHGKKKHHGKRKHHAKKAKRGGKHA